MTLTHGTRSLRRFSSILILGIGLSMITLMLAMVWMHGVDYTIGWFLGSKWPYPTNVHLSSAWWLCLGAICWGAAQFLIRLPGRGGLRTTAFFIGPLVALWVLVSWVLSLIFYAFGGWPPEAAPTGVRWLLDGPLMRIWHGAASSVLSRIGLPIAIEPVHFVDGSSIHVPGTVIVLGILNESMLACVVATFLTVVVSWASRAMRKSHEAA